ncbi:hypothetical protein F4604DRAFT_1577384 [Suillus subluteus]|nr:hypothetical protein F4604DRAFT_1577384 [Suillus subluteus]
MTSETVSRLNDAVLHFQLVLYQCPVSHPDHAVALTNLAYAHLQGYIRKDLEDIDATTSFFRDALALRPQCHPDHPLSLYNLTEALTWRHNKKSTAADIREAAKLYHELLLLFGREAVYLLAEGHPHRGSCLNELALSLRCYFDHQGKPNNLDEAILLHEETLCLWPAGHEYCDYIIGQPRGRPRPPFLQMRQHW